MIRKFAVSTLARRPLWTILRKKALAHQPATLLCYHTLSPDQGGIDGWTALRVSDFRAQLDDLTAFYDVVGLDEVLSDAVTERPKAVITFDDGDRGLFCHLPSILKKTSVPVTIYVATEQFETGRPFWFDRVVNALQQPGRVTLDGLGTWDIPETPGKARWAVIGSILQTLKQAAPENRDKLADAVAMQGSPPDAPPLGPMDKTELQELAAIPGVTIGAHSHGHELLDQIPLETATASIKKSRSLLQEWTGQKIEHFAFPNGNHSPQLRAVLPKLGFRSATILEERTAPRGCDPFALPRISVGRYDNRDRVRLRLAGL